MPTAAILSCLGLKKDLKKAADSDKSRAIIEWSKSIVGYLYWVATATSGESDTYGDVVEAKWRSLANHICNRHTHSSPLYPKCAHS